MVEENLNYQRLLFSQNGEILFPNCNNIILNLGWSKTNQQTLAKLCHNYINLKNCFLLNTFNLKYINNITNMFYNCSNLTSLDVSNWSIDNIENMAYTFYNCYNLTSLDVSNWNVSKVNNFAHAFNNCKNIVTLNVSDWNTSNVDNFFSTFIRCFNLTSLDVSNWDVSNANHFYGLFGYCNNLTTLNISNWKVNNGKNFGTMFQGCSNLTSLDISNWNISNASSLISMFSSCTNLTSLDVTNWNVDKITSFSSIFYNCRNLTSLNVSNWNVDKATTLRQLFSGCSNLTSLNMSNWNVNNVKNLDSMFYNCSNLTSLDIANWNTSNINNLAQVFNACSNLISLNVSNWNIDNVDTLSTTFAGCSNLTSLDIANWNTSKVNTLFSTFMSCSNLTTLDVSNWNVSKVNTLQQLFYGCSNLTTLNISNWDVSNVNILGGTFIGCSNLTSLDISNWNVSKVDNLSITFADLTHLQLMQDDPQNYDIILRTFNLTNWDTSNVQRMYGTFQNFIWDPYYYSDQDPNTSWYWSYYPYDVTPLVTFYNWNFSNVTNMSSFLKNAYFSDCSFPPNTLINWDTTGNVTHLSNAFAFNSKCHCWSSAIWWWEPTECNFSINTCNVTNLEYAFASKGYYIDAWKVGQYEDSCGGEYIHLILTDTSKVINANNAFAKKTPFNWLSVDGQDWFNLLNSGYQYTVIQPTFHFYKTDILNLYNVKDASNMFFNYLDNIPKITLYNVTQLNYAFASNYNADLSYYDPVHTKSVLQNTFLNQPWDTTNWNLSKVTTMYRTFADRQFSNQDLKNIANALLTAVNVTSTYKNLNINNTFSPFYHAWTWINTATVGSDITSQLSSAGWIIPS